MRIQRSDRALVGVLALAIGLITVDSVSGVPNPDSCSKLCRERRYFVQNATGQWGPCIFWEVQDCAMCKDVGYCTKLNDPNTAGGCVESTILPQRFATYAGACPSLCAYDPNVIYYEAAANDPVGVTDAPRKQKYCTAP